MDVSHRLEINCAILRDTTGENGEEVSADANAYPAASSDILSAACYSPHTELSILQKPIAARSHQLFKTMSRGSNVVRGGPAPGSWLPYRRRPMSNRDDLYAGSAYLPSMARRNREDREKKHCGPPVGICHFVSQETYN